MKKLKYICVYLHGTTLLDDCLPHEAQLVPPFNPQAVWDAGVEEMNEAMHQVGNNERSRLLATLLMRFQQFLPPHDAMIALNGVAKLMHDTDTTNGTVIIIRKDGGIRL